MHDHPPSKTQRKHEMHELQALGERLVALNDAQLARVALPDALREAVATAKRMRSREALRRQLQFIGRLMREVDAMPIREQLEAWSGRSRAATAEHHRIEQWRERLLADDAALTEFARAHPRADHQALHTCIRAARAEQLAGKPPRQFRALFRLIREVMVVTDTESADDEAPI